MLLKLEQLNIKPDKITIEGNSMVSDNEILSVMDLGYGVHILAADLGEMENRLEELSRIKKVKIRRNFPDSLKVTVEEVEPVGYLMEDEKRYVVTLDGDVFPGIEGPALKFKVKDPEKIRQLAELLRRIGNIDRNFYNGIIAIDSNYRDEVYIHKDGYYAKWGVLGGLDDNVIRRNIYIEEKIAGQYGDKIKDIDYIDLRFIEISDKKIDGAVLIK
ncbi:MAG: FtsQ-type POTRA domain-containing protein [Elusimicrobia bacterium]|nr:FtsQ-type POTRA domain-containing protein [Elusimicrobiota bacterium]